MKRRPVLPTSALPLRASSRNDDRQAPLTNSPTSVLLAAALCLADETPLRPPDVGSPSEHQAETATAELLGATRQPPYCLLEPRVLPMKRRSSLPTLARTLRASSRNSDRQAPPHRPPTSVLLPGALCLANETPLHPADVGSPSQHQAHTETSDSPKRANAITDTDLPTCSDHRSEPELPKWKSSTDIEYADTSRAKPITEAQRPTHQSAPSTKSSSDIVNMDPNRAKPSAEPDSQRHHTTTPRPSASSAGTQAPTSTTRTDQPPKAHTELPTRPQRAQRQRAPQVPEVRAPTSTSQTTMPSTATELPNRRSQIERQRAPQV